MKLDILVQSGDVNFKKIIENELSSVIKKMYIFSGSIKESGFEIIEENIIDKGIKLAVYMGIDKKNTTKSLLENILSYSSEVYVYNNNEMKEFEGTIFVFEKDKVATMYISSSKISENSLTEDVVMISKITYDLSSAEDKKEYKEKIKELTILKESGFEELKKSKVQELVDNKVIFSNKQYEHSVKSIAELLGKKEEVKEEKKSAKSDEDINASDFEIPVVNLKDEFMDLDIDVSGVEESITIEKEEKTKAGKKSKKEVKKEDEEETVETIYDDENDYLNEDDETLEDDGFDISSNEVIDLDSMLISRGSVKLKEKKTEEKKEENKDEEKLDSSELVKVKKLDLNNVTNLIMQLPAKQQNKKDLDIIKVPNYIRDLIPAFFEFPDNSKTVEEGGVVTKERPLQIEIVDCKNEIKYVENDAKMFQRKSQTFISILCPSLEKIQYEEKDIVRIIKLSTNIYHIEIVTKDMQEYKIWSKIMNKDMKSTDRKYGIM